MGDKLNPRITKEVVQQFETIRKLGINMGFMEQVYGKAVELGFTALQSLLMQDFEEHPHDVRNRIYIELLKRQTFYTKKFKLTR